MHIHFQPKVPLYFVYARSYSLIFGENDLSEDRWSGACAESRDSLEEIEVVTKIARG